MINYICPPIAVRILDNGVRVDLATGLGVLVPVPSGPPGRQGPKGDTGAGVPPGGAAGRYLRKASAAEDDCEWADLPAPPVLSVNGKTGPVELDAEDVGALPDTTPLFSGSYNDLTNKPAIPANVSDLANDSGFVNAQGAAAAAPVQSVNGQTGAVTVPEFYTQEITLNTSDWTVNQTKCFVNGKYVFAPFYVQGTPSKNKTIATGLPIPKLIGGASPITLAGSSPSIIAVNPSGTMYISSAGTGTIIGGVFCYETE